MRILYIDDEESMRRLFVNACNQCVDDCRVETAATGEAGLERLERECFDLLVTDLQLPGKSGLEVLRACRDRHPGLEVMVLTGHGSVSSAVEAMHLGARDFIEKPMDIGLLREKLENVRSYLGQRRELEDAQEAKDAFERHASHEVRLMERRLVKKREAVERALTLLSQRPVSEAHLDEACLVLRESLSLDDEPDRGGAA